MAPSLRLLLLAGVVAVAAAEPKVVPMKFEKHKRTAGLDKRDPLSVELGNAHKNGLYFVTAQVGTPGQKVQMQIDTGSSDVWMFGPQSCDSESSPCLGGNCE